MSLLVFLVPGFLALKVIDLRTSSKEQPYQYYLVNALMSSLAIYAFVSWTNMATAPYTPLEIIITLVVAFIGGLLWSVIINKDWKTWGSVAYKEANDVARLTVKAEDVPNQEQLTFDFEDVTADSAVAFMHWEKKKISFKIELDD